MFARLVFKHCTVVVHHGGRNGPCRYPLRLSVDSDSVYRGTTVLGDATSATGTVG
jgi:hypothetical protein